MAEAPPLAKLAAGSTQPGRYRIDRHATATTDRPSSRASQIVARTIFHASSSVSQEATKERSIFSSVNGRRSNVSSDE